MSTSLRNVQNVSPGIGTFPSGAKRNPMQENNILLDLEKPQQQQQKQQINQTIKRQIMWINQQKIEHRKSPGRTPYLKSTKNNHCHSLICEQAFANKRPLSKIIYETHAYCRPCRVYHHRDTLWKDNYCPCCHVMVQKRPKSRKGKEKWQRTKKRLEEERKISNAFIKWY